MTAPLVLPSNLPNNLKVTSVIDLRSQLPVNPNYTWAEIGMRDISALKTIVFHHDAWPKRVSEKYTDLQLAQKIARDHIETKKNRATGDAGFPYDAWIRNGILYICNDLLPIKWGVASNNSYTVHICVSGAYHKDGGDALTDEDRNAMLVAYAMYKAAMPAFVNVKGHGELKPSQCPGYDMRRVKNDISALELSMSVTDTPNDQLAKIFALNTRFADIYKKAINPKDPNNAEAIRKMLDAHAIWVDKGVL
jgi:hypothetical protein